MPSKDVWLPESLETMHRPGEVPIPRKGWRGQSRDRLEASALNPLGLVIASTILPCFVRCLLRLCVSTAERFARQASQATSFDIDLVQGSNDAVIPKDAEDQRPACRSGNLLSTGRGRHAAPFCFPSSVFFSSFFAALKPSQRFRPRTGKKINKLRDKGNAPIPHCPCRIS